MDCPPQALTPLLPNEGMIVLWLVGITIAVMFLSNGIYVLSAQIRHLKYSDISFGDAWQYMLFGLQLRTLEWAKQYEHPPEKMLVILGWGFGIFICTPVTAMVAVWLVWGLNVAVPALTPTSIYLASFSILLLHPRSLYRRRFSPSQ